MKVTPLSSIAVCVLIEVFILTIPLTLELSIGDTNLISGGKGSWAKAILEENPITAKINKDIKIILLNLIIIPPYLTYFI